MRRLFWVGVGAVASVVVVERVRRAARQYTPAAVSEQLTSVGRRTTSALHEARVRFDTARTAREQELVQNLLVTPAGGDAGAVFGGARAGGLPGATALTPPGDSAPSLEAGPGVPRIAGAQRSPRTPTGRVDAGEPLYDF